MEAYLDNSATTRCSKRVLEIVAKTMEDAYGNPSSLHVKGIEAEKYVKDAAKQIAKTLKAAEKEIVFTSGGTESNNLAVIGTALANKRAGKRIITTPIEHASVANPMGFLKEYGYEIIELPVDSDGILSLDALAEAMNEETILVSLMHVNNEIGAVEPIEAAAGIIHEQNPQTVFHVDAVQSYGKWKIRPKRDGIDLLSVSGHKLHGPKGVGFLYVKEKTKIKPLMFGGGQQSGMRSGTHNVPGIAGLGIAAEENYGQLEEKMENLFTLKSYFCKELQGFSDVDIHGKIDRESAPHIVNASFVGIRSEVLLHTLEDYGIFVSSGSACSSNKPAPSRTLSAIGLDAAQIDSAIRFSFSVNTTKEELDYTLERLREVLPKLRRYSRH